MSVLSQFAASVVKSVQYVRVSIGSTANSGTASITSVNTSKTVLLMAGCDDSAVIGDTYEVELTGATEVTARRSGTSGTIQVAVQVLEFY